MAGFILAHAQVVDVDAMAEYRQRISSMVGAFEGKVLVRGEVVEVIGAEKPSGRNRMIVLEFTNVEKALEWNSFRENAPENEEVRALRRRMGNVVFTIVDGDRDL